MVCYLVKLVHKKTGLVQYKRGITKWLDPLKRFEDEKYDIFDISVLNLFVYSNPSWVKANTENLLSGKSLPNGKAVVKTIISVLIRHNIQI